eukprot:2208041-Rhodomonas_salina.2
MKWSTTSYNSRILSSSLHVIARHYYYYYYYLTHVIALAPGKRTTGSVQVHFDREDKDVIDLDLAFPRSPPVPRAHRRGRESCARDVSTGHRIARA